MLCRCLMEGLGAILDLLELVLCCMSHQEMRCSAARALLIAMD